MHRIRCAPMMPTAPTVLGVHSETCGYGPGRVARMDADELIQRLRERRLTTLALADQISEERWREAALPGGRTIHDLLAHILGWDEWAVAVFDISQIRDLPPVLLDALHDVNGYNEKAVARFQRLTRDDLLAALQSANPRAIKSAMSVRGAEWTTRRIQDLASAVPTANGATPTNSEQRRAPSVRAILRMLESHEDEHDHELMAAFGIAPHLEQLGDSSGDAS